MRQRLWVLLIALSVLGTDLCEAAGPDVRVTGTGNVGIAYMSGGTVQVGLSPQEAEALAKVTGQELTRQLTLIVKRINTQQRAKNNEQAISLGVVQSFLATIKGKRVPQADWPQVFGELTRQFLELGARISATPVTSEQIKQLVARADEARKVGKLSEADVQLEQAEILAIQDARRFRQQVLESNRQVASLLASRASLAFTQLERERGASLLLRAFEQQMDDVSPETFRWLIEASDALNTVGKSAQALKVREQAQRVASVKAAAHPMNSEWQHIRALSDDRIGDSQSERGNLTAALQSYIAAMDTTQRLTAEDPSNARWQRNLLVSYIKIGDSMTAQGDLAGSLLHYREGLVIAQKLNETDPSGADRQRDLWLCYIKIGDSFSMRDDQAAAQQSLQTGLVIAQRLAADDPSNAERQRDLWVSLIKIGDSLSSQHNLTAALQNYQAGMSIAQKLAADDPSNVVRQSDLWGSYIRIGDSKDAEGDQTAALQNYKMGMSIAQKLAARDASNTDRLSDLWVGYHRIGDSQSKQGDKTAALQSYREGLDIARKLVAISPSNTEWQFRLVVSCWKLGTLKDLENGGVDSSKLLSEGLQLLETLQQQSRLTSSQMDWLAMYRKALGKLE